MIVYCCNKRIMINLKLLAPYKDHLKCDIVKLMFKSRDNGGLLEYGAFVLFKFYFNCLRESAVVKHSEWQILTSFIRSKLSNFHILTQDELQFDSTFIAITMWYRLSAMFAKYCHISRMLQSIRRRSLSSDVQWLVIGWWSQKRLIRSINRTTLNKIDQSFIKGGTFLVSTVQH